jgi:hypothetical protein
MTAATKSDAEEAVRLYLLFLEDPAKLRDDAEIQKKTKAVLDAADPIEKLKALAALERAANIDEKPLRAGFVANAKAWADDQGIPLGAFRELKVPDDVLREAGFDLPAGRSRGRGAGGGRERAKSVPVDDIKAHVQGLKGTFTLADIITGFGGSPATVRKAVDELIDAKHVKKLGPDANYQGRGRAPIQYATT